jgi:hypothetical protein
MSAASDAFRDLINATTARLNVELTTSLDDVQAYAAERMNHLSLIVHEPGYDEALVAEAMNVMLVATGHTVDAADAVDRELFGFIGGGLRIAAALLAAA